MPTEQLADVQVIAQTRGDLIRDDYPNMDRFAANCVEHGWGMGQRSIDDLYLDMGLARPSYSQPQMHATPATQAPSSGRTVVYKRSGSYRWFNDPAPSIVLPYAPIEVGDGTDHQGTIETEEGWYELWQFLDARSGPAEYLNRVQAWGYNAVRRTGATMGSAFAQTISFTPRGAQGNRTTIAPVMNLFPLILTSADLARGSIDHALAVTFPGKYMLTKPIGDPSIEPSDPRFGQSVGGSLSPAALVENTQTKGAVTVPLSQQAPEGMRLLVLNTDEEIERLLDLDPRFKGGQNPKLRRTMRIVMVCLRVFGMIHTQTGGASFLVCDGTVAAQTEIVHDHGVPAGSRPKLPPGTIRADNTVGLTPPTSQKQVGLRLVETKRELWQADRCLYLKGDLKAAA